jgi:uncharacterized protein (TIGR02118 family)
MAKLIAMYKTPADKAAFDRYYHATHVPIAKKVPGLRSYEISRGPVVDAGRACAVLPDRHASFDSVAAIQAALGSPQGQATAADLGRFATAASTSTSSTRRRYERTAHAAPRRRSARRRRARRRHRASRRPCAHGVSRRQGGRDDQARRQREPVFAAGRGANEARGALADVALNRYPDGAGDAVQGRAARRAPPARRRRPRARATVPTSCCSSSRRRW